MASCNLRKPLRNGNNKINKIFKIGVNVSKAGTSVNFEQFDL